MRFILAHNSYIQNYQHSSKILSNFRMSKLNQNNFLNKINKIVSIQQQHIQLLQCHILDMVLHILTYRADAMSQAWSQTLSQINAFVPNEVLHEFHFTHLVPTDRSRTHSARLKEFAHTHSASNYSHTQCSYSFVNTH